MLTQTYNAQGQRSSYSVTQASPAISLTEQFTYRGDGELGQAVVVTGTTTYTDTYIYTQQDTPLELLRQQGGTTSRYWYIVNGQGSVVALVNTAGAVVDRYNYDLWGNPTSTTEQVQQPLRYAGYWYDREMGWYWLSVRAYDPVLERFLQPDPSMIAGVRSYVYVNDDPVDATDASGLWGFGPLCNLTIAPFGGKRFTLFSAPCGVLQTAGTIVYTASGADELNTIFFTNGSLEDKAEATAGFIANLVPIDKLAVGGVVTAKIVKDVLQQATHIPISDALAERVAAILSKGRATATTFCSLCFPAGTLVATPDGEKPIQTLLVGQTVLAENPQVGKVEPEALQAVLTDPVSSLIAVDLSDDSVITVTPIHVFWVDSGALLRAPGWMEAKDLWRGDRLRTASGAEVQVVHLRYNVGQAVVYTLAVAKDHTFFVGTARVLVHNEECTLVRSLVKKVPALNDIASGLSRNDQWSKEANSLVQQLMHGNPNPGIGTEHLLGNIYYLRGRNGARVFYRLITTNSFEILAYSNKATEDRVISIIRAIYGN